MDMPTYDSMMNPLLEALHQLRGSGNIDEINKKTIELLNLPDKVVAEPHSKNCSISEIEYRLSWTRTYLKKYGLLENSSRGIWALTKTSNEPIKVEPREVVKQVKDKDKPIAPSETEEPEALDDQSWEDDLIDILISLEPDKFQRLSLRVLRECGFTQLEVKSKSDSGEIHGKGIIKIAGLVSFHAIIQFTRYQGAVGQVAIKKFKEALEDREYKGIFITTGFFSRAAIEEANRDDAPPINLIDGDELLEIMKELSLGVRTETAEKTTIDKEWFENI